MTVERTTGTGDPDHHAEHVEQHFRRGEYPHVIEQLGSSSPRSARHEALLGMALLRTGQFQSSEIPLLSAMGRGDQEAAVEYGNLLRALNENARAVTHFDQLLPQLDGELKYRALRWRGVARYGLGDAQSERDIEAARIGYLSLGDDLTAARLSHTLAALYTALGDFRKARKLVEAALPDLRRDPNPRPLLSAYNTLIDIQMETGLTDEAAETLGLATQLAVNLRDPHTQLKLDARRIFLMVKTGDYHAFVEHLSVLRERAVALQDVTIQVFASNHLANHLSRTGRHAEALRVMAQLRADVREASLETLTISAMLTLRRGDPLTALGELQHVRERALTIGAHFEATRAALLGAQCSYRLNDHPAALAHLSLALGEMAGWPAGQARATLQGDLRELQELIALARLTPELLPVLDAALEDSAALIGADRDDLFRQGGVLDLRALGTAPSVQLDGVPHTLKLPYAPAILAYLALEPGRTRHEITADLWGDHDPVKAGQSFRQALVEIRRVLGADVIVMEGSHQAPRYSLSPRVSVLLDSQRVLQLVARGDLPAALTAYRGVFLARLTGTEWIDMHRDALRQALSTALRQEMQQARLRGEDRRVVVLASAVLDVDPDDFETEELRLEAARRSSSAVEYARFEALKKRRWN